jgi:hypothetical protein
MTNNTQQPETALGTVRPAGERPGSFLDEREQRLNLAYDWCLRDPEVQRQYQGKVVAAQQGKIWGWGKNHAEAWDMARRQADCPPPGELVFVVVPGLPVGGRTP